MKRVVSVLAGVALVVSFVSGISVQAASAQVAPSNSSGVPQIIGPPGVAMAEPVAGSTAPHASAANISGQVINATYTHTPTPNSGNDLTGNGDVIMPQVTIYYDFWLPTGDHFESNSAGDTNYENLLIRFAKDLGGSQYHNLLNQYDGTNGTVGNTVTYGGMWVDTAGYPETGAVGHELQDSDIQTEVHNAATTNGWTEDDSHIIAVFTADNINECMSGGSPCTDSSSGGFCAYHDHFNDGGDDSIYAYMSFDNFVHATGKTCVAGQTSGDNDPNRGNYPNGDVSADAEVSTFSHELAESETDPHPNNTWTGPLGEIGDACNFTYTPRADNGADIYLNGHPYIVQELWSNAVHTCAIDLPTNGFCTGSVSDVCAPDTTISKSVDNSDPSIGSTVNYTISLDNKSDTGVETNLSVSDTAPAGIDFTGVSASSSASASISSNVVTVTYDYLAVHQTRSITVTATVPETAGGTYDNCGSLAGGDLLGNALSTQDTSPCASLTVAKGATTTSLSSNHNPSVFAQSVTFTATVSAVSPATGTPTGNVEFLDGSTPLGTEGMSGGQATFTTSTLSVGTHTIYADYQGDSNFLTSSTSLSQVVNKEPTTTALTCLPSSPSVNQAVTCTAVVSPTITNPVVPTGTVSFYIDGSLTPAATAPLSGGQASFMTTFGGGAHTVVAVYSGDGNYLTSTSNTENETVACTVTITGTHGSLIVSSGTTCVLNATITGGISVAKGAVLDVENSVVEGSISASAPSTFRMCGDTTGSVTVTHATGFVLIGDPTNNCPANTIDGSILAAYNTGGLVIVDNTVTSNVTAVGNSGSGPLPGESTPVVSGNHH